MQTSPDSDEMIHLFAKISSFYKKNCHYDMNIRIYDLLLLLQGAEHNLA